MYYRGGKKKTHLAGVLENPHQFTSVRLVLICEKCDALSGPSGSTSTPNPVNVVFNRQGESDIDDELRKRDIAGQPVV